MTVVNHRVSVQAPPCYMNLMCGLCGNWNGDQSDDELSHEDGLVYQFPEDRPRAYVQVCYKFK